MFDLLKGIAFCALARADGPIKLPEGSYQPGFLTVLAAWAARNRVCPSQIEIPSQNRGYLQAVGFGPALGGPDSYAYDRRNAGKNYSVITPLRDEAAVDMATSSVNGCIRELLKRNAPDPFTELLCKVVGELHDNVWSHGMAPGFSHAQRYHRKNGYMLEISISDGGIGLAGEMRRVGRSFGDDQDAIIWCMKKGNTTKGRIVDDWAQSLPSDAIGSPYGPRVSTRTAGADNHHQGLGLHHLSELVRNFRGELIFATGNCALQISPRGSVFSTLHLPWNGVALCCRFDSSALTSRSSRLSIDSETRGILERLQDIRK